MRRTLGSLLLLGAASAAAVENPAPEPPEAELLASERVRLEVEAVLAELHAPPAEQGGTANRRAFYDLGDRLIALGAPAVPFMASEIDEPSPFTFNVAAYALGALGTPEAVTALRKAVARADSDGGKYGAARKVWAIYGLAIAGDEEAVRLLDTGLWVGGEHLMERVSLVELAAALTAPRSVPILLEQLERQKDDPKNQPKLIYVIRALGRIADPSARDAILPFMGHERWQLRAESLLALSTCGGPADADRLLAGLEDPQPEVKQAAARALERLGPAGRTRAVLARLELEPDSAVRGPLYGLLAEGGQDEALEAFATHWGREDYIDRLGIVRAVTRLGSPKGLNLLRAALRDPDAGVALNALDGITRIGSPGARDTLLALLRDPREVVVQGAIEHLVSLGEKRAAPRVAEILVHGELGAGVVTDPLRIDAIRVAGEALVELRYAAPLPEVRAAWTRQREAGIESQIASYLEELVLRLAAIDERGDDPAKWSELLGAPQASLRLLAASRLAELGGPRAVSALEQRFPAADPDEQLEILRAMGRFPGGASLPLLERVLTTPEFDAWERRGHRSVAAWAARRVGGARMAALLRAAAERRKGLDIDVLTYLGVLEGKEAIPVLRAWRLSRLASHDFNRGVEQERLDRMAAALAAGRGVGDLDLPPEEIRIGL